MLARNIRSDFISQETTRTFYLLLQYYQLCSVSFSLNRGKEQQRASKPRCNHPTKGSMKHTRGLVFCQRQMPLARTTRKKKDRERHGEEEERQRKRWREKDFTLYVPGYSTSPSAKPNTSLRSTIYMLGRIIATILWYRSDQFHAWFSSGLEARQPPLQTHDEKTFMALPLSRRCCDDLPCRGLFYVDSDSPPSGISAVKLLYSSMIKMIRDANCRRFTAWYASSAESYQQNEPIANILFRYEGVAPDDKISRLCGNIRRQVSVR